MKKLLFNGCSFIAGDQLVWKEFLSTRGIDNNKPISDFYAKPIMIEYFAYRRKFNLPFLTAENLKTEHIDLSADGKSNDDLALTTINEIKKFSREEKDNLHVVIGWTEPSRRLRWLPTCNSFANVNIHTKDPELSKYIEEMLINASYEDYLLNYMQNIIMLESYLKDQKITYTLFRSMGIIFDNYIKDFYTRNEMYKFDFYNLCDISKWINFDEITNLNFKGFNGISWDHILKINPERNYISKTNYHPTTDAVKDMVNVLSNWILRTI